ncbi:MAG: hypothetical protein KC502_10270 [Myxococcales bacterium]|nr:hypothetical protein [Myxococcales bacterium]
MSRFYSSIVAFGLLTLIAGCGNSGGGGGGVAFVGGAVNSTCNTQYHNQGCFTGTTPPTKVQCTDNAGTQSWQEIGKCAANQYCIEEVDPADSTGVKKVAKCKDIPANTGGGTDAGGTGVDSAGGGTTDGGGTPKKTPAEEFACIGQKCPTELSACMTNPKCAGLVNCAKACKDETCRDKCSDGLTENDQAVLVLLLKITDCGQKQKCIEDDNQTNKCGNGQCDEGETSETCAQDCKKTGPQCGNGQCEEGESPATCSQDCKVDGPKCGNEKCEAGESYATCKSDCPCKNNAECGSGKVCNDGQCQTQTSTAVCGNFKCESGETASGCPVDCDPEAIKALACTKDKCATYWNKCQSSSKCVEALNCMTKCKDENCVIGCATKAPADISTLQSLQLCVEEKCSASTSKCGNGKCDEGETASSCAQDCKTSSGCKSNSDCPSGQTCAVGKCITGGGSTCTEHSQCNWKKGEKCESGKCVSNGSAGSCQGKCGGGQQTDCYCDSDCIKYGDCCKDWCAAP